MKDTKIKEPFENAFHAFFEDSNNEPQALTVAGNTAIVSNEASEFSRKADKYYSLFKKIFLFFPGVLMLHLVGSSFAVFYNQLGLTSNMLFWFAAGTFMTWAGIGDLKNKKHGLIPLSVILLGLATGIILDSLPNETFLLLPLFFIAPILTKNVIDRFEENETDLSIS